MFKNIYSNLISKFKTANIFDNYLMISSNLMMPVSGFYLGYLNSYESITQYRTYTPVNKYSNRYLEYVGCAGMIVFSFAGGFIVGYLSGLLWPITSGMYFYDKYNDYNKSKPKS